MTTFRVPGDLHPLLARLVAETGASVLDAPDVDAWAGRAGPSMLMFTEGPARWHDALALGDIVPELNATAGRRFRVALLRQGAACRLASRLAFPHWPACVILRDGLYVGAIASGLGWTHRPWAVDLPLRGLPLRPPATDGPARH